MITASDNIFGKLRVWVDTNLDGVSQPNELKALDNLGIEALYPQSTPGVTFNAGNWVGREGSYLTADGQVHDMNDIWFRTEHIPTVTETHAAIASHASTGKPSGISEPAAPGSKHMQPNAEHEIQLLIARDTIATSWP